MPGYVYANGTDESLLGREKTQHYEVVLKDIAWLNPLSLNFRSEYYGHTLPVKGSLMTMDFMMEYNSKSLIDTGLGWGWVHNHQIRIGSDPNNGDLLLRGGSGTIHRFPKISDDPLVYDHAKYTLLKPYCWTEIEDGVEYHWIRLQHVEGNYTDFLGNGMDFVPMWTYDPYGRYYYYDWDIQGRLSAVKTDYTSRQISFSYGGPNGRLSDISDTTSNPRNIHLEYSLLPGTQSCYVLEEISKNNRVERSYYYTGRGELNRIDNSDILVEYCAPNAGTIFKADVYSEKDACTPSEGLNEDNPTASDLYDKWEYSEPVPCQEKVKNGDGEMIDNPMYDLCCDDDYRATHPDECQEEEGDCDPNYPDGESECDDPETEAEEWCKCCCCDCLTSLHKSRGCHAGESVTQIKFDTSPDGSQTESVEKCKEVILNATNNEHLETMCHICDDLKMQYNEYGLLTDDNGNKADTIARHYQNELFFTQNGYYSEIKVTDSGSSGNLTPKTVASRKMVFNERASDPWVHDLTEEWVNGV